MGIQAYNLNHQMRGAEEVLHATGLSNPLLASCNIGPCTRKTGNMRNKYYTTKKRSRTCTCIIRKIVEMLIFEEKKRVHRIGPNKFLSE